MVLKLRKLFNEIDSQIKVGKSKEEAFIEAMKKTFHSGDPIPGVDVIVEK